MSDGRPFFPRSTQNSRILDVLTDGGWHTCAAIHQRAGFSRLNSRVAELRTRGYMIECRHVEGAARGPEAYEYRLVGTPGAGEPWGVAGLPASDTASVDPCGDVAVSSPAPGASARETPPDLPADRDNGAPDTCVQLRLVA